jgi:hypothetical protein
MRKLMTAAALVACAGAGTVLAPTAANAAVKTDQLIICGGGHGRPLTVTVENLTYDNLGPVPFTLTGPCQTIVDGNSDDYSQGTPLSSSYRVAAPLANNIPNFSVTETTSSGVTFTHARTDEITVQVSSLEGVQLEITR